ncbi:transposable element Tcb2 transposase [Trichonephila clavipes]|nr:transposable element Tcb2 transposase [Trichonephila clavipes]
MYRFTLNTDSRRITICRKSGTGFSSGNIGKRHHFLLKGVISLVIIIKDNHTILHRSDTGFVTDQKVLRPYVLRFRGAVDPGLVFMDDNTLYYRTIPVNDLLERENILRKQ